MHERGRCDIFHAIDTRKNMHATDNGQIMVDNM